MQLAACVYDLLIVADLGAMQLCTLLMKCIMLPLRIDADYNYSKQHRSRACITQSVLQ